MSTRIVLSTLSVGVPLVFALASACNSSSSDGGGAGEASKGSGSAMGSGGSTASSGGASSAGTGGASAQGGAAGGASGLGGNHAAGGASQGGTVQTALGGATSGGAKSTGHGGGTSSSGGASSGGGSSPCLGIECLRAFECVEKCGGPLIRSGCCPCENGTIDRVTECRGSGGAGGGANAGGAGGEAGFDLSKLNTNCMNGACPSGLTPVKFYGVAGTAGPEFCWCTIPCSSPSVVCPSGTTCQTIADGPGQVCSATH